MALELDHAAHDHVFLGGDHERNERRTWMVIALTAVMMVVEIVAGLAYGSMALLADGVHMSTHAGALLIAALAYLLARRHADDRRFTFGTGKFGDLAAFASAIILAVFSAGIAFEAVMRIIHPISIRFGEAILVAAVGLAVNLISAALLHHHGHGHDHPHDDHNHRHALGPDRAAAHAHADGPAGHEHHDDRNLRAAYLHVLADALTSVLAILGLVAGWIYGQVWVDALVGLLGAAVIARWSFSLLKDSGAVLLDVVPNRHTAEAIRTGIESGEDRVADLHLWRVGPGHLAAIVSIVSDAPQHPHVYKQKLRHVRGLSHLSVEVVHG
ncbi:CDF family Co(II)/Ni(II) efflux transporter DmeF [Aurantimonas sp. VKM B-3413]|uniref:CDF family Co(II)/Ni(II) efflux transporter DmeF n=1 Tax=Aurantimonas sp. VKM B-3413 TaxID=2779401 RepID=UPI001E5A5F40|nr:CDF family Co(II)/Ni(II) efflux transporter DmeF [Aurantimonas sp. VKM B-3413]MCB8838463.1 CDF family Co(II)/Ni(II) efflux transporter DmeF [Aurantimonas sp. VKM B-3413]